MRHLTLLAAVALLSSAGSVAAQDQAADFPDAAPLTETDLDAERGGQAVELTSTQVLTAESIGNSVTAEEVGSGSIALQGDALSGFNGVANVVVNTGHNNNLQGSVSVNVIYTQDAPPPTTTTP
jgi:hypothetical protein